MRKFEKVYKLAYDLGITIPRRHGASMNNLLKFFNERGYTIFPFLIEFQLIQGDGSYKTKRTIDIEVYQYGMFHVHTHTLAHGRLTEGALCDVMMWILRNESTLTKTLIP